MKKTIIILLLAIVVPIYVWDAYQLLLAWKGSPVRLHGGAIQVPPALTTAGFSPARKALFVEQGKSPFFAYAETEKPRVAIDTKVIPKAPQPAQSAKPPPAAPKIIITGIMWNPQSPLAMLTLPDGSSLVAKAGQTLPGGIVIKTIEKNRIQVVYEKASFWIAQ
jgi:type IV pilus biogenesis protein PilP